MSDVNSQLPSTDHSQSSPPGSEEDERRRRSRLFFLLFVVLALCLCLGVGIAGARGGLFNFLRPPTETPTLTNAPADQPNPTENVTETEAPTEAVTPGDTPSPTISTSDTTPEVTEPQTQGDCKVVPGDGKCDVRCENTDLDPQDCTCNVNNVCDPGEGFNCPDCSYGQCGQACGSDADCHNPGLNCSNGVCGGPSCGSSGGGGGAACKCECPKGPGTCRVGKNSCTGDPCRP